MEKDLFLLEQNFLADYVNGYISDGYINDKMPEHIKEEFHSFCSLHNLPKDSQSIESFVNLKYNTDNDFDGEDSLEVIDINLEANNNLSDVFEEWNRDLLKISQLSSSDNAVAVSKWRWQNPQNDDMQNCSNDTHIPLVEVKKWWNTVDWIDSYCGGHFHLCTNDEYINTFISEACSNIIVLK